MSSLPLTRVSTASTPKEVQLPQKDLPPQNPLKFSVVQISPERPPLPKSCVPSTISFGYVTMEVISFGLPPMKLLVGEVTPGKLRIVLMPLQSETGTSHPAIRKSEPEPSPPQSVTGTSPTSGLSTESKGSKKRDRS